MAGKSMGLGLVTVECEEATGGVRGRGNMKW